MAIEIINFQFIRLFGRPDKFFELISVRMRSEILAEADEAEGSARASAERQVAGQEHIVQVEVVLAIVNYRPRSSAPGVMREYP